jgi:Protein of unknown function (DUF3054)
MVGYRGGMRAGATAIAAAADACCVLAFVVIGRHAHGHGDTPAGIWYTAWPFLAGLAIGLTAVKAWRRPLAIKPAGVGAWLGAAWAGMVIRVLAGQGTAAAFLAVATAFLALFVLGWRVAVAAIRHFRRTAWR